MESNKVNKIFEKYPNIEKNYFVKKNINKNHNMIILMKKGNAFDETAFCFQTEDQLERQLKEIDNFI